MTYQKRRNGKKTPKKAAPGARRKATSAREGSGNRVVAKTPRKAPKRDLSRPMYRPIAKGCEYCGYAIEDGHSFGCPEGIRAAPPALVQLEMLKGVEDRLERPWWRRAWEWLTA